MAAAQDKLTALFGDDSDSDEEAPTSMVVESASKETSNSDQENITNEEETKNDNNNNNNNNNVKETNAKLSNLFGDSSDEEDAPIVESREDKKSKLDALVASKKSSNEPTSTSTSTTSKSKGKGKKKAEIGNENDYTDPFADENSDIDGSEVGRKQLIQESNDAAMAVALGEEEGIGIGNGYDNDNDNDGKGVEEIVKEPIPLTAIKLPTLAHSTHKVTNTNAYISIEAREFDAETYEHEALYIRQVDAIVQGGKRLICRPEESIRWRYIKDPTDSSQPLIDKRTGKALVESNARWVEWSDGSTQIYIGDKPFNVSESKGKAMYQQLWALNDRSSKLWFGEGTFDSSFNVVSVNPSLMDRRRKLFNSVLAQEKTAPKVKMAAAKADPEAEHQRMIQEEARANRERAKQLERIADRAGRDHYPTGGLGGALAAAEAEFYSDEGEGNIGAIKQSYARGKYARRKRSAEEVFDPDDEEGEGRIRAAKRAREQDEMKDFIAADDDDVEEEDDDDEEEDGDDGEEGEEDEEDDGEGDSDDSEARRRRRRKRKEEKRARRERKLKKKLKRQKERRRARRRRREAGESDVSEDTPDEQSD